MKKMSNGEVLLELKRIFDLASADYLREHNRTWKAFIGDDFRELVFPFSYEEIIEMWEDEDAREAYAENTNLKKAYVAAKQLDIGIKEGPIAAIMWKLAYV